MKYKLVFLVLFVCLGLGLYLYKKNQQMAALFVDTIPQSKIYVNGVEKGTSPLTVELPPQQVTLLLVPQSTGETKYESYETKINLPSGIKSVVRKIFADPTQESLTQIISYDHNVSPQSSINIVSVPDGAQVFVDGVFHGNTPIKIYKEDQKVYAIAVQASGHMQNQVNLKTQAGYNTTFFVSLPRLED